MNARAIEAAGMTLITPIMPVRAVTRALPARPVALAARDIGI